MLESKDLLLAVRNGYLNAYVEGQSVFKAAFGKGGGGQQPAPPCDPLQYLVKPDLEEKDPYVSFDGKAARSRRPKTIVKRRVCVQAHLAATDQDGCAICRGRKKRRAQIARKEPKVVDLEIAFTEAGENGDLSAPRIDIAVLVPVKRGEAELVFCEAKCADNREVRDREKPPEDARFPEHLAG